MVTLAAIASAIAINVAAIENVTRMPVATASGGAEVTSVVAEENAKMVPINDAPMTKPKFRDKLSMPEMTPRWSACSFVMMAVLLAV